MNRYIDADSVRDEILYGEAYVSAELEVYIKRVFDNTPTADVAPVVHARWIGVRDGCGICSNCNRQDGVDPLATHCRYCGAKMDLEG